MAKEKLINAKQKKYYYSLSAAKKHVMDELKKMNT